MEAYYEWLNSLVNRNKDDYAEWPSLSWLNYYNAGPSIEKRERLLEKIGENLLFKGTKPYYKHIPEGCRICGSGKWSCLFITGKCNAGCFYCPAPQSADELPSTQGLEFPSASAYASYINFFGFRGVSFSGGEPLLYFKRTLEYLKEVRQQCDPGIYTWMYTNGILADREKMKALASAGLNEIRFDIGATAFSLEKIKAAKGVIPDITIEIPAIPEEAERMMKLLPELESAGVTSLNLHQLRLTKYNARQLAKKDYTFIHAEKPIVLESELAALEILNFAKDHSLETGINYCSFFFKHRFQKAGFRHRLAAAFSTGEYPVTENGYMRKYDGNSIMYTSYRILNALQPIPGSWELVLEGKIYHVIEEQILHIENIDSGKRNEIEIIIGKEPLEIPDDPLLFRIWQLEYIEKGLREYC